MHLSMTHGNSSKFINDHDIFVSYDISSLFTNVPLNETIEILAEKAFCNNWFNETHKLEITRSDFIQLLKVATKDQLFQVGWKLYEQVDGVAMGSLLGPLMANSFMCSLQENLKRQGKMPSFYKRYVDDTLTIVRDAATATTFLETLNNCHPSVDFTMEQESNNKLSFLGMQILTKTFFFLNLSIRRTLSTQLSPSLLPQRPQTCSFPTTTTTQGKTPHESVYPLKIRSQQMPYDIN